MGRLVESPDEIVAALARYRTFGGRLDPATGRAAGYDFLQDGADAVRTALAQRRDRARQALLIGNGWTQDDLTNALLPRPACRPDRVGERPRRPSRLLPPPAGGAAPIPFSTSDLTATAAPNLSTALVFSMGCHAGLDVSDAIVGVQTLDWPQAYGHEGATYLGNTGFGYGDTDTVAYSEELNRLLAEQVAAGGTIGNALRLAKNEYFCDPRRCSASTTRRRWPSFTLYGLPMWSIGAPVQTQAAGSDPGPGTSSRRRATSRRSRSPRPRPAPTRSPASRWSGSTHPRPSRA